MQVIFAFSDDPEDYVHTDAHLKVCRPNACPNCMLSGVLLALGYYTRWVSSSDRRRTTLVRVRRFRCHACRRTTSMLPDFAQPYRLVATDTVEQYLGGSRCGRGYAEALLLGTPKDMLVDPGEPRLRVRIPREELARMEMEMETLERDYKVAEDKYSENMLNLTVLLGYVRRLLGNAKIVRFLGTRHVEMLAEFERIAASDGI